MLKKNNRNVCSYEALNLNPTINKKAWKNMVLNKKKVITVWHVIEREGDDEFDWSVKRTVRSRAAILFKCHKSIHQKYDGR